jgi:uncharacterized protein
MRSRRLVWIAALGVLVGLLPLTPMVPRADAQEAGGSVVVSQVYGGGGNSGATYTHDFIELFNRGSEPVNLSGWSVQYASATGSTWQVTALSGTLQPGQYYLVQQAQGAGGTTPLPTPDASGTIAMSATNGKVALVDSTTSLSGTCPAGVVDFVGFGSTANCFEGSGPTATLSNTTAALRVGDGCVDTDDNAADFGTGAPTPRNTASPLNVCDGSEPPPPPPSDGSDLVVSQVYGGGGNSGATYTHDFIELFNRGSEPVNLSGWSVQYASATGSTWQVTALSGTLQPGQYYLVQQAQGAGGTTPLPTPDASGTIAMSATNGKVALVDSTTSLSGTCPAGVVDFVGFGSTANCFEGSGPTATLSNTTAALRVGDGCVDTDDNAADFGTGAPTPRNTASPLNDCDDPGEPPTVCPAPPEVAPISMVQGPGDVTPCAGEMVTIRGVVVGDYQGPSPALRGFYVQSTDDDHDADELTSEGIFVFNGNVASVSLGDLVLVTGVAAEFQGQTQLGFPEDVTILGNGRTVTPTEVKMPFSSPNYLERYEGMLVTFPQTLYVTEFFQLGRFGEIVVSSVDRLAQPTNVVAPGRPAAALQAENNLNRLKIDDHLNNQNPDPILFGRGGDPLSAANTLRGGDTVTDATGVMTYGWAGNAASPNSYRLRVVGDLSDTGLVSGGVVPVFEAVNQRPTAAPDVGGTIEVASFNVLNYFLTFNQSGNLCGPVGFEQGCRGADNGFEFERQRTKLIEALFKMDSDVVGLIELENTTGVEPLADIVAGLNDRYGEDVYDFVEAGTIGTDVIKVGMIYKPAAVTPIGQHAILDSGVDARYDDDLNRPALAQTFVEDGSGEVFTVVVNHFKSKGCSGATGANLDQGDGQSCWNPVRVAAAEAMVDWLASYPTGFEDDDFLITGDLNSYAKEDPIAVFEAAGYVNLIELFGGDEAYSYVFDGQWGYLDHALASPSLAAQVAGTAEYHINADEPSVLDYNTNFKSAGQVIGLYAPDEFRTSDHDPVVVGLTLDSLDPDFVATPGMLWPPNHTYRSIALSAHEAGVGGLAVAIIEVTSSEADSGLDPEDLPDDIVITGEDTVDLRAERFSTSGRIYTITAYLSGNGQVVVDVTIVVVPHNLAVMAVE